MFVKKQDFQRVEKVKIKQIFLRKPFPLNHPNANKLLVFWLLQVFIIIRLASFYQV